MKFVPWALSAVLAALLLFVFISKGAEIKNQEQQLSELQNKYSLLVADTNKKQTLLDEASKRQSQIIDEANKLLTAANQPELTVSLSFRPAMMGNGLVATIRNTSGETIAITADIKRPSSHQSKNFDLVLNGNTIKEIGHMEGWAFVDGDTLTLQQPNHKSKIFTAH